MTEQERRLMMDMVNQYTETLRSVTTTGNFYTLPVSSSTATSALRNIRIITDPNTGTISMHDEDNTDVDYAMEEALEEIRGGAARRRKPAAPPPPVVDVSPIAVPALVGPVQIRDWEEVTKSSKVKLPYSMGIELTMTHPLITNANSDRWSSGRGDWEEEILSSTANAIENVLKIMKYECHDVSRDIKVVEASSEKLNTWGEVKEFYDVVGGVMRSFGLKPHVDHVISGGGHIHVGGLSFRTMANMLRDVQNKPWLNWVFNDPDDSVSSNSYCEDLKGLKPDLKKACAEVNVNPSLFGDVNSSTVTAMAFYGNPTFVDRNTLPNNKRRIVRYCSEHKTFEFRFFRAPVDWEEQMAHVKFVEAYIKWIEEVYKDTHVVTICDSEKMMQAVTIEQSREWFYNFLEMLGLPKAPYVTIVEDNLEHRYSRGKRI